MPPVLELREPVEDDGGWGDAGWPARVLLVHNGDAMSRRVFVPKLIVLICLIAMMAGCTAKQAPVPEGTLSAEERLAWFKHDKFGMFIHWGPYAVLAGEWNDRQVEVGDIAEWIMQRLEIPVAEYREVARGFNPVEFDARSMVKLAKDAGMKYLVFTSKHHDGFATYHSKVSDYNIVDWTEFDRDPLRELAEECRRQGIRFGIYYSHREDWNEPYAYGNTWDFDFDPEKDLATFEQEYLDVKAKPQLREILSNYGEIALVWFDRGIYTPEQAKQFADIVHELQPKAIINGRIGSYGQELLGDYQNTSDNLMPPGGIEEYWETPQTLNHTWGFSKFDTEWKNPAEVVRRLVDIVSKGGNYLLNIGPDGLGRVPQASVDILTRVGEWVRVNDESIYGTTASPFAEIPWGACTVKGETLYLHVFDWPEDGKLALEGLRNQVRAVRLLAEPEGSLTFERNGNTVVVAVPAEAPDPLDSVLVMEIAGSPEVDPVTVAQNDDGSFHLDYLTAVTSGRVAKRFNRKGEFHISKWKSPQDKITWHLELAKPGTFEVEITYAALEDRAGAPYVVSSGEAEVSGKVEPTGDWYEYKTFSLGSLGLPQAGVQTVEIRPQREVSDDLMYFKAIELRRR